MLLNSVKRTVEVDGHRASGVLGHIVVDFVRQDRLEGSKIVILLASGRL